MLTQVRNYLKIVLRLNWKYCLFLFITLLCNPEFAYHNLCAQTGNTGRTCSFLVGSIYKPPSCTVANNTLHPQFLNPKRKNQLANVTAKIILQMTIVPLTLSTKKVNIRYVEKVAKISFISSLVDKSSVYVNN